MRSSASTGSLAANAAARVGLSSLRPALELALARPSAASAGAHALLDALARRGQLPSWTVAAIVRQVVDAHPPARRDAVVAFVCDKLGVHAGLVEALHGDAPGRAALPACTRAVLAAVAGWSLEDEAPPLPISPRERADVIAIVGVARYLVTLASGAEAPGHKQARVVAAEQGAPRPSQGGEGHDE